MAIQIIPQATNKELERHVRNRVFGMFKIKGMPFKDAEDVIQDSMHRIFEKRHTFDCTEDPIRNWRHFVNRFIRIVALEHARAAISRRTLVSTFSELGNDEHDQELGNDPVFDFPDDEKKEPEKVAMARQLGTALSAAIEDCLSISGNERTAVEGRVFGELSLEEAGKLIERSPNRVKYLETKFRDCIKRKLKICGLEPAY